MIKNNQLDPIEEYIKKVDHLLPYNAHVKRAALVSLRGDVMDALKDAAEVDPLKIFGDPYKVAKDLSAGQHWAEKKAGYFIRTAAYIIDFCTSLIFGLGLVLVGLLLFYIGVMTKSIIFGLIGFIFYFMSIIGLIALQLAYFMLLEGRFSTTLGKKIFGLKTVDQSGIRITWSQAIVRIVSKLNGTFLIFDILIGKYFQKTYKQRALDTIAQTIVIKT